MPADGIELIFDGRLTNLARLQMHGLDANLRYQRETAIGAWDAHIGASYLFDYDRQANAASLPVDVVDSVGNPIALRVRAGLGWRRDAWRAALGIAYAGAYRDNLSVPGRKIAAQTTFDARVSHTWDQTAAPPLRGLELALSAVNLTDEDPPFVNSAIGIGFDSTNATAQGRILGIELNRHW
jgi:outer membrane receptor protein involved in Fe transport